VSLLPNAQGRSGSRSLHQNDVISCQHQTIFTLHFIILHEIVIYIGVNVLCCALPDLSHSMTLTLHILTAMASDMIQNFLAVWMAYIYTQAKRNLCIIAMKQMITDAQQADILAGRYCLPLIHQCCMMLKQALIEGLEMNIEVTCWHRLPLSLPMLHDAEAGTALGLREQYLVLFAIDLNIAAWR